MRPVQVRLHNAVSNKDLIRFSKKERRWLMKVNRRDFLKISAGTAAGVMVLGLGMDLKPVKAYAQTLRIRYAR